MAKSALQRAHVKNKNDSHPDHFRRKAAALAVAACFSVNIALANPTNPAVVHGTATFQQAGSILNVTNSHNAIINWGSFSIGINELTRFIQPSALSAVLNRVVGQDPSAILGALQSNGRVFLINPNGILFGAGAQINVAGLVASTLNMSNADFLAGRMNFTDGVGAGSVVNQGSINAAGGPVYMVGNAVTNNGIITSPGGEVVLAAGNSVELVNPGTPNLRVEIVAPNNEVRNLGTIAADAGRIGIYAGLIKQGGVISADSAVAEGGRIVLKSTRSTTLDAGSVTSARGTSGGEIIALSSMTDGVTQVSGRLDASAIASGVPGQGGFIETSAAKVSIADSASIATGGNGGGAAGIWLIDPFDFVIAASGGDITAPTLTTALNNANVVISTAYNADTFCYGGSTCYGGTTGLGDILVQQAVVWNSPNSLTLTAERNVQVDQAISNTGIGGINLNAGWDGISSSATPTVSQNGQIILKAPITTGGDVSLLAFGNISQDAAGSIATPALKVVSTTGSVDLTAASNSVGTIAGRSVGQFAFKNAGNLTVGTVGLVSGIIVEGAAGGTALVDINVTAGNLTVDQQIVATGYNAFSSDAGHAAVNLSAAGGITINALVKAQGGSGGSGTAPGGDATVTLTGSSINVNATGSVVAQGGAAGSNSNFYSYFFNGSGSGSGGVGGKGGNAAMTLTSSAAGGTTINGGTLTVQGGQGGKGAAGSSSARGGNGGDGGKAELTITANAGGGIRVENSGGINVTGGYGGDGGNGGNGSSEFNGIGGDGGTGGNGGIAKATLVTNGGGKIEILTSGQLNVSGGRGGSGGNGGGGSNGGGNGGNGGNGGEASLTMTASGNLEVISGSISVYGGDGGGSSDSGRGGNAGVGVAGKGGDGGNGGDATLSMTGAAIAITTSSALNVYGGSGGTGGSGGNASGGNAGNGGNGGNGGVAKASLVTNGGGSITVAGSSIYIYGGDGESGRRGGNAYSGSNSNSGGVGGAGGNGGKGGLAELKMTANDGGNVSVLAEIYSSTISVRGGDGAPGGSGGWGSIYGANGIGGKSGSAVIQLTAAGAMGITGSINADGGERSFGNDPAGSATISLKAGGTLTLSDAQIYAQGGGSSYYGSGDFRGEGGAARVQLESTAGNLSITNSYFQSRGADAARNTYDAIGGQNGGAGSIEMTAAGAITITSSPMYVYGGDGGEGAAGGDASIIMNAGGGVGLTNAYLYARGGDGQFDGYSLLSGQGGDATVVLNAGGGIAVSGGSASVNGGYGSSGNSNGQGQGGNATLQLSAVGNIQIDGGEGFSASRGAGNNYSGGTPGTGTVFLGALGDITLTNAYINSTDNVGIAGANVSSSSSYVQATYGSLVVGATGSLSLTNNSSFNAAYGGNATVSVLGNVVVNNNSAIQGEDVVMSVGGVINLDNGGTIQALSPNSIYLTFPMLTSAGYYVNGVEGVVFDGNTGFFANGSGAILGQNLLVTYGGSTSTVLDIPTEALIVAMNQAITPPEKEQSTGAIESEDEKNKDKKKDLPICGK